MLRSYPDVVRYHFETYATDDVIAETDAALPRYIRPSTLSPVQYAEALVTTSLRCKELYNEYVRKGIFTGVLHKSVRRNA